MTLAACSNDDDCRVDGGKVAAQFTANIANGTATRAYDAVWEDGDAIGITATDNTLMAAKYANCKYTTSSSSLGNFTAAGTTTKIYFQDQNTVGFTAYYPFSDTAAATGEASDLTLSNTSATSSVIVFPQDAPSVTLSVTIDGQVYSCSISPTNSKLDASNRYVYTITASKTGLTATNCSIAAWTDGGTSTGTATMQ